MHHILVSMKLQSHMDSPEALDINISHGRLFRNRKLLARLSTKHFKVGPIKSGTKKDLELLTVATCRQIHVLEQSLNIITGHPHCPCKLNHEGLMQVLKAVFHIIKNSMDSKI